MMGRFGLRLHDPELDLYTSARGKKVSGVRESQRERERERQLIVSRIDAADTEIS